MSGYLDYLNYPGVIGSPYPQRSNMDQKMQNVFGVGTQELYVNSGIGVVGPSDFGQRSIMDIRMQQEFNPYYRRVAESYKAPVRRVAEGYCGGNGSNVNPQVIPNPNIQTNGKITYLPLQ